MSPGFLAVLTHPSSQLSLDDFHAWYEEEHIPLRMDKLKEFISGARYRAADHDIPSTGPLNTSNTSKISKIPIEKPDWLAMYEIDDTETFNKPVYTNLRTMRSERETDVMRRLEVVERRVGSIVWDSDEAGNSTNRELKDSGRTKSTGLRVGNPCQWIVTTSVSIEPHDAKLDDELLKKWAEDFCDGKQIWNAGVERVRVINVQDWGCTSMGPAVAGLTGPKRLFIFECYDQESARKLIEQNNAASENEGAIPGLVLSLVDWRLWNLWKAYPSLAQSESSS